MFNVARQSYTSILLPTDPGSVENLRTTLVSSRAVRVAWDLPSNATYQTLLVTIETPGLDDIDIPLDK